MKGEISMQATTSFGSIALNDQTVVIERRSLPGLATTVRTIEISRLAGVDLRKATAWEPGYLRLIYPGASSGVAGKLRLYDPDTIMFDVEHQEPVLDAYDALITIIGGMPYATPRPKPSPISPTTVAIILAGGLLCAAALGIGFLFRV